MRLCPPHPPHTPCYVGRGGRLSPGWAGTGRCPSGQGYFQRGGKGGFSSLIYIIYLKRNVFTRAFFPEVGHLVLIPFIISVSLLKRHCSILVFIMGASRGLPCPPPPPPLPLLSLLLPQLYPNRFHCVYKTSANKLILSPSLLLLLKFIAPYFLKPRQQDAWGELGEGLKRTP